ncbi:hypothetical protein LCGC14_1389230 [marine sediment metagenome]|uniref:Uncharacterized protein n=1 Tax=marine sediment metagenome TaxID=412755 RepID=A0A0F9K0F8_9ZZZZ
MLHAVEYCKKCHKVITYKQLLLVVTDKLSICRPVSICDCLFINISKEIVMDLYKELTGKED